MQKNKKYYERELFQENKLEEDSFRTAVYGSCEFVKCAKYWASLKAA